MKAVSLLIFAGVPFLLMSQSPFLQHQLTFPRVQAVAERVGPSLNQLFRDKDIPFPPQHIYLRAFKQEQVLEVFAADYSTYRLIKTYPFTATSGKPGPKRQEGDLQIPEGFYQVSAFNPLSKFLLSFKINYPNHADNIRNKNRQNQGGDIYIHGGAQTIGCIPLGDDAIQELYWLCASSFANNPVIPVHIFPCRMDSGNMEKWKQDYPGYVSFWKSLLPMYRFFESHKLLGEVTGTDDAGNYLLSIPWD